MDTATITASFGPSAGDRATLSKPCRATLDALYRHPIAHNLEWSDVTALLTRLGKVGHASSTEIAFGIGGEHHVIRRAHGKDLTAAEIMDVRHILSRAGWSPDAAAGLAASTQTSATNTAGPDLLVVVDHHEAKLYRLDLQSADSAGHVIRPYDPHHFLHHLTHKDQSRERGQRAAEDPTFYERIAQALVPGGAVIVVGHGTGHSDAAHHLVEYLRLHHAETFKKVQREVVADLSSLTAPQLLVIGRKALFARQGPAYVGIL